MKRGETVLTVILRILGTSSLFAIPCALMPHSWMDATHQWLGLGHLPDQPVVGYLARSTSLFYGLLGGLLWVVSFDLPRHRTVLCYLGGAVTFFGLMLFGIDLAEGMPLFWSFWEGPLDTATGMAIFWLSWRLPRAGSNARPGHEPTA